MIEKLTRKNLKSFKPYDALEVKCDVKLDANENSMNIKEDILNKIVKKIMTLNFNRYPDPASRKVCRLYADYAGADAKNVMAGNGSDELIQIIVSTFVDRGESIMCVNPDFSMYKNYAKLAGGRAKVFELNEDFSLDVDGIIDSVNKEDVKVLFLSNPNNPVATVIKRENILKIVDKCNSIVVIDEAYIEFYGNSVIDEINNYENLIVLRTCSKAVAMAAIRLGFLITNYRLLQEIKKVKPPFNVNSVTQAIGEVILENTGYIREYTEKILQERKFLFDELKTIDGLEVYGTHSNFVIMRLKNSKQVYEGLLQNGISVRNYLNDARLSNFIRITVGSRKENELTIECLKKFIK
ncbi:histidinol-phosphate transaminase [Clostridium fermenticellae]|uniref:Histidinol-phosphate aminotransferase n=1 Tax=Clostridium fermenticellae TaxID=2068654 RepID=A0A386H345_9CLOT|nr:histidinol-phosphate transaminase [Clostridium fermenticellae]AYD40096.1 histidinol-phosphate transaminase [Clostridium fermenticellae]